MINKMFTINAYKCIILIWFIVKVYEVDSATQSTFRCKKGNFIKDIYFCDGDNDCDDKSDESSSWCQRNLCPKNFSCDGMCKAITVRCNTKSDCLDGSDETNCGDEIITDDCTLEKGKYLCDDNLRCIYLNYTCDNACNCFDCSDEKSGCLNDIEMEEYAKKASSHTCFRTPNGPHCCSEYDSLCHECGQNQCEQKCVEFRQEARCFCDENYTGVVGSNNRLCVSNETRKNTLIYSTNNNIAVLDLFTNSSRVIRGEIDATALTSAHDNVYYATFNNSNGHIFKTSIASNETHEIIISDSKITSLAIDWITNQTYYSTNTFSIIACSKDGKICKQLKSRNAHSIVLAPRFGLLFWVETGNSSQYIMKSAMDGSDETILTVCDKISLPITIAVDETTEIIYFWTSLMELSFISFNGNRKKIYQPKTNSPADRALFTVFEKKVYFSVLKSNQIHLAADISKLFMTTVQFSDPTATSITHLYAYNPKLQRTEIPNPCADVCIDGLCLLRPSSSRIILNYTCFHEEFLVPIISNHSNEHERGSSFGDIMIYVLVGILLVIFLLFIGRDLFIGWKKELFRNDQSTGPDVSLELCKNNELLADTGECSKYDKNEFVKNNCNKLESSDYKEKMLLN